MKKSTTSFVFVALQPSIQSSSTSNLESEEELNDTNSEAIKDFLVYYQSKFILYDTEILDLYEFHIVFKEKSIQEELRDIKGKLLSLTTEIPKTSFDKNFHELSARAQSLEKNLEKISPLEPDKKRLKDIAEVLNYISFNNFFDETQKHFPDLISKSKLIKYLIDNFNKKNKISYPNDLNKIFITSELLNYLLNIKSIINEGGFHYLSSQIDNWFKQTKLEPLTLPIDSLTLPTMTPHTPKNSMVKTIVKNITTTFTNSISIAPRPT